MYIPDFWCVIKINSSDPHYRVFATFAGGYTSPDSWRMNSGIVRVEESGDYFDFYGSSGSLYRCHKTGYGCHWANQGVLKGYLNSDVAKVDLLPKETNWNEVDWIIK